MNNLQKELTAVTNQQWTILISLLTLVNLVILGGLVWLMVIQQVPGGFRRVLAAPPTRTPNPTFTVSAGFLAFATPTGTFVPTWTPTITPTPAPTETPTITPIPTRTLIRATAVLPPTPTPTPEYDYIGTVRQMTPCENEGKHHIFAYVRDPNGVGLPGVKMRVFWSGGNGGEATLVTGTKIEDPGLADFAMFKGSYFIEVMDGTSQVLGPISPDIGLNETCESSGNTEANSLYHYSFEVVFTKVR
jgi:hypothetical protein